MTDTLAHVLHERADSARFEAIDLEAITLAGSRAVRRRRWAGGAAVMVCRGRSPAGRAVGAVARRPIPKPAPRHRTLASGAQLDRPAPCVHDGLTAQVDLGHEVASLRPHRRGLRLHRRSRGLLLRRRRRAQGVGTIQNLPATAGCAADGRGHRRQPRRLARPRCLRRARPGHGRRPADRCARHTDARGGRRADSLHLRSGGHDGRRRRHRGPASGHRTSSWPGRTVTCVRTGCRNQTNSLTLDGQGIGPRSASCRTGSRSPRTASRLSISYGAAFPSSSTRRHGSRASRSRCPTSRWPRPTSGWTTDTLGLLTLRTVGGATTSSLACSLACRHLLHRRGTTSGPGLTDGLRFRLPVGEPYFPYPHG